MKKIFLLAILFVCAETFAKTEGEKPHVCVGKDRDDVLCNALYKSQKTEKLECSVILNNQKCQDINPDARAYHDCCEQPAQNNIVSCKMTNDKFSVYCKDEKNGEEAIYQLKTENGVVPLSAKKSIVNKGPTGDVPYDSSKFYAHPDTKDTKCKITPDKSLAFCKDIYLPTSEKELTYVLLSKDGVVPLSGKRELGKEIPLNGGGPNPIPKVLKQ